MIELWRRFILLAGLAATFFLYMHPSQQTLVLANRVDPAEVKEAGQSVLQVQGLAWRELFDRAPELEPDGPLLCLDPSREPVAAAVPLLRKSPDRVLVGLAANEAGSEGAGQLLLLRAHRLNPREFTPFQGYTAEPSIPESVLFPLRMYFWLPLALALALYLLWPWPRRDEKAMLYSRTRIKLGDLIAGLFFAVPFGAAVILGGPASAIGKWWWLLVVGAPLWGFGIFLMTVNHGYAVFRLLFLPGGLGLMEPGIRRAISILDIESTRQAKLAEPWWVMFSPCNGKPRPGGYRAGFAFLLAKGGHLIIKLATKRNKLLLSGRKHLEAFLEDRQRLAKGDFMTLRGNGAAAQFLRVSGKMSPAGRLPRFLVLLAGPVLAFALFFLVERLQEPINVSGLDLDRPALTDAAQLEPLGDLVRWRKNFGGKGLDQAAAITALDDGGFIACGTRGSVRNGDIYVIHTGPGGSGWEKNLGGSASEYGLDVAARSGGGSVVLGLGLDVNGSNPRVLLKALDAQGRQAWQASLAQDQGQSDLYPLALAKTEQGYAVLAEPGSSVMQAGQGKLLILVDERGKEIGRSPLGDDQLLNLAPTADKGLVFTGESQGGTGLVLIKTDQAGQVAWRTVFGQGGTARGQALLETSEGDLLAAGSMGKSGAMDGLVVLTDAQGRPRWLRTLQGPDSETVVAALETDFGFVVLSKAENSNLESYATVTGLDKGGEILWERSLGVAGLDLNVVDLVRAGQSEAVILATRMVRDQEQTSQVVLVKFAYPE